MEADRLVVPLLRAQVEAAQRLHHRCDQWRTTDKALARLAEHFPGFGPEETLLKVAAVNALYGTNVYAIGRMAEHVRSVMLDAGTGVADSELVERMAALPRIEGQRTDRRHYSFASKFAHFFVDPDRFPIYDYYAAATVRYHLGRGGLVDDSRHQYRSFVANFRKLKILAGFRMSTRDLDRYLWLAGQYREWFRRPTSAINTELRRMFETPTPEVAEDLKALLRGSGQPGCVSTPRGR